MDASEQARRIAVLTDLVESYGQEATEARLRVYLKVLAEVPAEELERASLRAVKDSGAFPPTPGLIWKHVRTEWTGHGPGQVVLPAGERGRELPATVMGQVLEPGRRATPRLAQMLRRAEEIRAAGRVERVERVNPRTRKRERVATLYGQIASYVLAARELGMHDYLSVLDAAVVARAEGAVR